MYRFGFIVEQALGHVTHGKNLQKNIAQDHAVEVAWGLPSWEAGGLAGRTNNWTVKAGLQSRQAVRQMQREKPVDALLFHTQVTAILAQDWMGKIPSIVSLDATPLQYDSLGEFYDHEAGGGRTQSGRPADSRQASEGRRESRRTRNMSRRVRTGPGLLVIILVSRNSGVPQCSTLP